MKNTKGKFILLGVVCSLFIMATGYSLGMTLSEKATDKNHEIKTEKLAHKKTINTFKKGPIKTSTSDAKSKKTKSINPNIPTTLKDGEYFGSAFGFKSMIKVSVTVKDGKIKSIKILKHGDDQKYFNAAFGVVNSILSAQTTNVDSISGATYSSNGIKKAVAKALSKNKGGNTHEGSQTKTVTPPKSIPQKNIDIPSKIDNLNEGKYKGSAFGYNKNVKIQTLVSIKNGKIKSIKVIEHKEDEEFFNKALKVLKDIVNKQKINVDNVSGATFSSNGLKLSVSDALSKASKNKNNLVAKLRLLVQQAKNKIAILERELANLKEENHYLQLDLDNLTKKNKKKDQIIKDLKALLSDNNEGSQNKFKNGIFEGKARGYRPYVYVKVTVESHKIKSIEITKHNDDDHYINRIKNDVINTIISAQVIDVINETDSNKKPYLKYDAYAGATKSSKGIINGVKDALNQ